MITWHFSTPTIWLLDLVDRPTYGVLQMIILTYLLNRFMKINELLSVLIIIVICFENEILGPFSERLTASYAFLVYRQDSPVRSGPSPLKCIIWLNVECNTCYSCHQKVFKNILIWFFIIIVRYSRHFAHSICHFETALLFINFVSYSTAAAVAGATRCRCCGSRPSGS